MLLLILQFCESNYACDHVEVTFDINGDQLFTCALKKDCGTYPAYVITPDGTNVFHLRRKLAFLICQNNMCCKY